MADYIIGALIVTVAVGLIAAGYIVHMWHVLKEIARENAREEADRMFDDYVRHCTYRIHQTLRIVDEMGRR